MNTARRSLVKKIEAALSKPTPFQEAVAEGVRISKAMQAATQFGDSRDQKLSAKAYLEEALYNGRTSVAKLRKLEKVLSQEGAVTPWISRFLGNAFELMVATRVDRGAMLRPACANLHMVLGTSQDQVVYLLTEGMVYGTNPLELMALAALRATEAQPDAFGSIDDYDKHMSEGEENYRAFRAACARVQESASAEDFFIVPVDAQQGLARVTYRWKGENTGIVAFRPDAGADLIAWVWRTTGTAP